MGIRLIAGLGNPGREHERDRHNVGFWFVERLAAGERTTLRREPKYHGLVGRIPGPSGDLWLVMPQTYMNASGRSVGALARFFRIAAEEVLVVHDELDFPPGTAKLKQGGGAAGHNGLRDLIAQLGTQAFWRLRIGIGHPGDRDVVADYVLSAPPAAERELIDASIDRALGVVPQLAAGDFTGAMHRLHSAPEAVRRNRAEPGPDSGPAKAAQKKEQ